MKPGDMMDFVNLHDVEAAAESRLPAMTFSYYAGGAGDEITLRENRRAYDALALRPRVLVDVSARRLDTTVLGAPIAAPILIAPMAFQGMAHAHGEAATARAAGAAGLGMVLSTLASRTAEDVRAATRAPLWYQLYVFKDRGATRALVERVESADYGALVLTVDAPLLGRRERDVRSRFQFPAGVPNVAPATTSDASRPDAPGDSHLAMHFLQAIDPSISWRDIEWLRGITRLPIVVKGILRGDDAMRAAEHGAAAVIVSNHGGRQLDTAIATIRALPDVAEHTAGRIELLVDGGIRRGTDIVKALALGARAVLVGRPILWGLAVGGEAGVARVLAILRDELDLAMALAGCASIADIGRDLVA